MGRTKQSGGRKGAKSVIEPFSKVAAFVKGKFADKTVRNAGFASKHAKIHLGDRADDVIGDAWLRYWDTDVATLNGNVVRLDMGGWRTRSTARAMKHIPRKNGIISASMQKGLGVPSGQ